MKAPEALFAVTLAAITGCQFQASCNSNKTLRMDKAKEFITSTLTTEVGTPPTAVTCPASVKIKQGATFECTAAFGDVTATVVLRQEDTEGYVKMTTVSGVVISTKLEPIIADHLGKKLNAHFSVDCGTRMRASTPGDKFTCTATDAAGARGTIAVDIKDRDGNVHFEPVADAP